MAQDKALLWRAFDSAERMIAPPLEQVVRSGGFAQAIGAVTKVQAATRRQLESNSRRLLHRVNLPAASDVTRLRRQVASLEREMHQGRVALEGALAELRERTEDAHGDDAGRPGRSDAAGRRAQRASRP